MFINFRTREINLKIVYYGPAYSGKTTNLEVVHQRTPGQRRSEMVALKTRGDRTLFFDYMQIELQPLFGMKPKFNLYTVPGQAEYAATRKLVLQGADGVIFVADAQSHRVSDNIQALLDMYRHLKETGGDPRKITIVIQFNKMDLPNSLNVDALRRSLGLEHFTGIRCFEAAAAHGRGVFETLKHCISSVVEQVQQSSA